LNSAINHLHLCLDSNWNMWSRHLFFFKSSCCINLCSRSQQIIIIMLIISTMMPCNF
jgi:hypothetical protein